MEIATHGNKLNISSDCFKAQPDPFMCRVKGGWVMYVTAKDGVEAYFSNSPFGIWQYKGIVCKKENYEQYWAPCMICIDDWYYLYFSCQPTGYNGEQCLQYMHVSRSRSPFGPFGEIKCLYNHFSIDPHMVKTDKGLFLWYAMDNIASERVGTRVYVEHFLDPYTPEGNPKEKIIPSFDEEIFMRNRFKSGEDWHTIEGPFWFSHNGYQFVMYSGACYQNDTYHIGYAAAKSDQGDLTKVEFKKHTLNGKFDPLMIKNSVEEGIGHNSVIFYNGDYYAVYHARDIENSCEGTKDRRTARICKLKINGDVITL